MIGQLLKQFFGSAEPPPVSSGEFMREPTASGWGAGTQLRGVASACVNLITGQLTPCTRRVVDADGMAIGHPLDDLLAQPCAQMSGWLGWHYVIRALLAQGNGYFIVRRGRGGVPVEMTPALEGGVAYDSSGHVSYTLTPFNATGRFGASRTLAARDVVAAHWYGHDGLTAPSPIRHAAAAAIGVNHRAMDFVVEALLKARETGPAMFTPAQVVDKISLAQIEQALGEAADRYRNARAERRIPILPAAMQPTNVAAFATTDTLILELLRWSVEDVARIWGVAPARLGQMSGGGAGVRTQGLQDQLTDFEATAVRPVARMLDGACTHALLTPGEQMSGLRVQTETWPIGLGSMEDRANISDQLVARAPIMTPNEARRRFFGLPPVDGGDELRESKGAAATSTDKTTGGSE